MVGEEVAVSLVPSTTVLSAMDAVSGVEGSVCGRVTNEDWGESDFIRTRRACSNTSWVMIPWVWVRSRLCVSGQRRYQMEA